MAHTSQLAEDPTGLGRTTYRVPIPLPGVDCSFDNSRGWNDVPPAIAAVNTLLNQFGGGDSGEKYDSRIFTTTLDWTYDRFDVQAILNYHDQNTK